MEKKYKSIFYLISEIVNDTLTGDTKTTEPTLFGDLLVDAVVLSKASIGDTFAWYVRSCSGRNAYCGTHLEQLKDGDLHTPPSHIAKLPHWYFITVKEVDNFGVSGTVKKITGK